MSFAVRVENVSKSYRINRRSSGRVMYRTLRDDIVEFLRAPLSLFSKDRPIIEDFWALKDVSFEVPAGQVVGIVGRNGAGKSTLLKILSRVTEPTSGRIRLRGRVGSLLEVGTGFHPELSGRENVFLSGAVLGMTRAEVARKFDEIVAFAEVEKFLDLPVKRYSSGMYMRLAFAVAAHLEPDVLVVDEVLAVGDAEFQKKCLGRMKDVSKKHTTVLFVSHNLPAVLSMCDAAIWIDHGEVKTQGPTAKIVGQYREFSARQTVSRRWEADDKQNARLISATLKALDTDEPDQFTVQTPLEFEFEAFNPIADAELNFSIVLDEAERGCIFNVGSPTKTFPAGVVRGSFVIPGNFINDGDYRVRVLLVKDTSVPLFDEHDVLSFEVHDVARQGNWFGRWIGAVRPTLQWKTEAVPHEGGTP